MCNSPKDTPSDQSKSEDRSRSFQSKVRDLLLLILGCGLACLLVDYAASPMLASCVLAAVWGWLLYRWVGLNLWGVLLWCTSMVVYYATWGNKINAALHGTPSTQTLPLIWTMCIVASSLCFLVTSIVKHNHKKRNAIAMALLFLVLIGFDGPATMPPLYTTYLKSVRKTTRTLIGFHQLDNEIESFQAKLGRMPNDEKELTGSQGDQIQIQFDSDIISYHYSPDHDGKHYLIYCCMNNIWGTGFDLWGYMVYYFGPNSTQRIRSEPF